MTPVEVNVLGPLQVRVEGREVRITSAKQRTVISLLACRIGMAASNGELIEALWADAAPRTAQKGLQLCVSNLRRLLPEGSIDTTAYGYRLAISPEAVDIVRFESWVEEGQRHLEAGNPASGAARFR